MKKCWNSAHANIEDYYNDENEGTSHMKYIQK